MTTPSAADDTGPEALRLLCLDAARQAGELLQQMRRAGDVDVTATKTTATDIVTNADSAAEHLLRSILLGARAGDAWLGEETGSSTGQARDGQVRWIVDPIDGTVNYLFGLPGWAVSVAAELAGEVVAGAVVIPTLREEFSAAHHGVARCNDEPLTASSGDRLEQALVATGFSYDANVRRRQGQVVAHLLPLVRDIRRLGAASVDLCSVAAGRVDAYYETGLQPWDRAAGALIARRAGATVTESARGDVVAAGPKLFEVFTRTLREAGA
ncbi:MAG TPA: inositol monophosphatase family protein [Actinomycetes bacterium]|nr:inositol monophosphatase family protein [Actinomycetes bacterium]